MRFVELASVSLPVFTFLVLAAYFPGIVSSTTAGRWAVLAAAPLLLWRVRVLPGVAHLVGAALLAWCALGLLWSASPWDTAGSLLQWGALACVFCAAFETAEDEDVTRRCIYALTAGVWVSVPFVVGQYFGYEWVTTTSPGTPVGLFLNRDMLAEVAALALIGLVTAQSERPARWFWWYSLGPALCIALTGSREPVLMLLVAAAVLLWHRTRSWALAAIPLVILGFASAYAAALMVQGGLPSFTERLQIWWAFLHGLSWAGAGLDTVGALFSDVEFVHSEPLHFAFELGLGSALLFALVAVAWRGTDGLARVLFAALGASACVSFPLHVPSTAFLFALLAGRLAGTHAYARRREFARRAHVLLSADRSFPLRAGALHATDLRQADLPL